jgi:hypothetical protein
MGTEVDYQVAAPAEMRTPNLHRAKIAPQKSADGRMATKAARLKRKNPLVRKRKTDLTLTGLLMEGLGYGNSGRIGQYVGRWKLWLLSRVRAVAAGYAKS